MRTPAGTEYRTGHIGRPGQRVLFIKVRKQWKMAGELEPGKQKRSWHFVAYTGRPIGDTAGHTRGERSTWLEAAKEIALMIEAAWKLI